MNATPSSPNGPDPLELLTRYAPTRSSMATWTLARENDLLDVVIDSELILAAEGHSKPLSARRLDPAGEPLDRQIVARPTAGSTAAPATRPRPRRRRLVAGITVAAAAALITTGWVVLPTGSGPAGPSPAAAAVLGHLSDVAAGQAPLTAGYAYTKTTSTDLQIIGCPQPSQCGSGPSSLVTYNVHRVVQTWVDHAGAGRYRSVTGAPHLSSAAAARLRSWGQPIPTAAPATIDEPLKAASGTISASSTDWSSDATVLASQIVTRFEGGHAVPLATADFATQLLATATSPQLRAALFRVLAGTPGIAADGAVRDRLGRPGQAFHDVIDGVRTTWIVDPSTGNLLSRESVLTEPANALDPASRALPAGTVFSVATFSSPQPTATSATAP